MERTINFSDPSVVPKTLTDQLLQKEIIDTDTIERIYFVDLENVKKMFEKFYHDCFEDKKSIFILFSSLGSGALSFILKFKCNERIYCLRSCTNVKNAADISLIFHFSKLNALLSSHISFYVLTHDKFSHELYFMTRDLNRTCEIIYYQQETLVLANIDHKEEEVEKQYDIVQLSDVELTMQKTYRKHWLYGNSTFCKYYDMNRASFVNWLMSRKHSKKAIEMIDKWAKDKLGIDFNLDISELTIKKLRE